MAQLLYTSSYKKPGVYIGQIIEPGTGSLGTASRIPVMIGKGSRYAQASNSAVVRAYVYEEELDDISQTSPYTATLKHPALKDQSRAELVRKSDGYVIPEVKWQFGDDAQSIIISEDVYVVDDEYTLSYQSTDRTVLDPTPVLDIISVGSCGSSLSTSNFAENRDYYIAMSLENLKKIDGDEEVETEAVEFDPRYESGSLYPTWSANQNWLSANCDKYNGLDNLEIEFTAVNEGSLVLKYLYNDEEKTITVEEAGKFYPLFGDWSSISVAVNDLSVSTGSAKLSVVAGKIFPTAKDNRKVKFKILSVSGLDYTTSSSKSYLVASCANYAGDSVNFDLSATVQTGEGSESAIESITLKDTAHNINLVITAPNTEYALNDGDYANIKVSISNFEAVVHGETIRVSVTKDSSNAQYTVYYATNTPEGGFGTITTKDSKRIILPGNVILKVNEDLNVGDQFSFELINQNVIDWNLTLKVSSYFRVDSVYRDVNGTKTGTPGAYYVILNGIPLAEPTTESNVEIQWIEGTSYVVVSNAEGVKPQNFSISYEYAGNEPAPGDTYYITTKHIRPDDMYNRVIFISSRAEGEKLLAPSTSKNDLYIGNEIAWDEIGARAGYQIAYIQIKDSDDDGVLSSADVQAAIDTLATSKKVTDFVMLGNFEYIGKLLAANELGNDPFECHENEVWVGCPSGTEVGDINVDGTLVNIAQAALKVYGNENPAHGTRVMVGSTEATKKITLEGNIEQSIKLDGSFIAWALACHRSRMRPASSIMREVITAFDYMNVYDDVDDIVLGQNQIIYFSKSSDGVYLVEEDFTTDKYSFEFSIEQITSQRLQVVRDIRAYMNESLIGYTPDTPASGVTTIVSFLVRALKAKVTEGVIAPYQNEDGTKREIDPSKDIFVTFVKDNPTQYQFGYGFYTKKVMKQLFGSYVVDKDFVDTGLGN